MKTIKVSSTDFKRNSGKLLDEVRFNNLRILVTKSGEEYAELRAIKKKKSLEEIEKTLKKYAGAIPDFPYVTKDRRSGRKKTHSFD